MGDEKELDLSLFEQLDEALEERATGSDRRKKNVGVDDAIGEDRRKGDRRLDEN